MLPKLVPNTTDPPTIIPVKLLRVISLLALDAVAVVDAVVGTNCTGSFTTKLCADPVVIIFVLVAVELKE